MLHLTHTHTLYCMLDYSAEQSVIALSQLGSVKHTVTPVDSTQPMLTQTPYGCLDSITTVCSALSDALLPYVLYVFVLLKLLMREKCICVVRYLGLKLVPSHANCATVFIHDELTQVNVCK